MIKDLLLKNKRMEEQLLTCNAELEKVNRKIATADERLDEAEYGVKRRRGTLISLQKMSDKRLQRFGFDKTKLVPIGTDNECLTNKEITDESRPDEGGPSSFDDILKKSKEKKETTNIKKTTEKFELEFRRKLFMFKRTARSVEEHGLNIGKKILIQKSKVNILVESSSKENEDIKKMQEDLGSIEF